MSTRIIPAVLILVLSLNAMKLTAQTGEHGYINAPSTSDIQARVGAGVDWKICRGLHATLDEECRFKNNLGSFSRSNTELGLSYKICPWLKTGADYTFIYKPLDIRHRAGVSMTGHYKTGLWNFSLRERVQCTHLTREFNEYQKPRNSVCLKSRVKVSRACFSKPLEPYIACEFKHILNGSEYTNSLDPSTMTYTDTYLNRIRASIGTEWRISRNDYLDFYALADFVKDKKLDARKNGELKTITFEPAFVMTFGIAYRFAL